MTWAEWLSAAANVASIATGVVAVVFYFRIRNDRSEKQRRLENYLKAAKEAGNANRPVLYLMAELGMSEADIMDAAFRSRHINRRIGPAFMGAGAPVLLSYSEEPSN